MIYTKAEIRAFARNNFSFSHDIDDETKETALTATIAEIEKMPPDQQLILIQGYPSVRIHGSYVGMFNPKDDSLIWGLKYGLNGINTMHHEHWHRIDHVLASDHDSLYYSLVLSEWEGAIDAELIRNPIVEGGIAYSDSSLYLGATKLHTHLRDYSYNFERDKKVESAAEMGTNFNSLYRDYEGGLDKIDEILSAEYPDLWPVFRDKFLPATEQLAKDYSQSREFNIQAYVDAQRKLYSQAGFKFKEDVSRQKAGLLLAAFGEAKTKEIIDDMNLHADTAFSRIADYIEKSKTLSEKKQTDFDKKAAEVKANRLAFKGKLEEAIFDLDVKLGVSEDSISAYISAVQKREMQIAQKPFAISSETLRQEALEIVKIGGQGALDLKTLKAAQTAQYLTDIITILKHMERASGGYIEKQRVLDIFENDAYYVIDDESDDLVGHCVLVDVVDALQDDKLRHNATEALGLLGIMPVLEHLLVKGATDQESIEIIIENELRNNDLLWGELNL